MKAKKRTAVLFLGPSPRDSQPRLAGVLMVGVR
jgi:hypothetical protein